MLVAKKKLGSSFGPDGRRLNGNTPKKLITFRPQCSNSLSKNLANKCSNNFPKSNKLFQKNVSLVVKRAPIMAGLSVTSIISKKFQRPMTGRRSYDKQAEIGLRRSSLGQKRRSDGMARLMARAGRGLNFKLQNHQIKQKDTDDETSESDDSEEEKEEEKPFEPLCVWTSPHQGGEAVGLPPTM